MWLVCPVSTLRGRGLAIPPYGPSSVLTSANPDPSDIEVLDQILVAAKYIIVDRDTEAKRQAQE